MCTTASKRLDSSWYLIKTRDPVSWMRWDDDIKLFDTPVDTVRKLIIQNPDPNQDGYYGGINEKGVAFISTYVHVAENQISYIRRPYVRLILEATTAKEAIKIIESFNPRIGGNMFVADSKECYGIEGVPEGYFVEQISTPKVKTNHFIHFPHKELEFAKMGEWSRVHKQRAEQLIETADSVEKLEKLLQDRENSDKGMAICTTSAEDDCFTHSAFICDTKNVCIYYAQGNPQEAPFKKYDFKSNLPKT